MNQEQYTIIKNNSSPVHLDAIPCLNYEDFYSLVCDLLKNNSRHCLNYFCVKSNDLLRFYCFVADDATAEIAVFFP